MAFPLAHAQQGKGLPKKMPLLTHLLSVVTISFMSAKPKVPTRRMYIMFWGSLAPVALRAEEKQEAVSYVY